MAAYVYNAMHGTTLHATQMTKWSTQKFYSSYDSISLGFAGSDAKVEYLKSIGFDAAYNYKTISSIDDALKEACPNGVDTFFDNVSVELMLS